MGRTASARLQFHGDPLRAAPAPGRARAPVEGLYTAWIQARQPRRAGLHTTDAVREVILAFRRASEDPAVVAAVFTGRAPRLLLRRQHARVRHRLRGTRRVPRVHAPLQRHGERHPALRQADHLPRRRHARRRRAGIGMACDFSIAQDLARFGQAGPKHGSAPTAGHGLPPALRGIERAIESITLCEPWSAHKAQRLGLLTEVVPALARRRELVPNPLVETGRWLDTATGASSTASRWRGTRSPPPRRAGARARLTSRPLDAAVDASSRSSRPRCPTADAHAGEPAQAQARALGQGQGGRGAPGSRST